MKAYISHFIDALPIPAVILLQDSTLLINQQTASLFSLENKEWQFEELADLFQGNVSKIVNTARRVLLDGQVPSQPLPYVYRTPSNQMVSALVYINNIADVDGQKAYLITFVPSHNVPESDHHLLIDQGYINQLIMELFKETLSLQDKLLFLFRAVHRVIPYTSASVALVDETHNFRIIAQAGKLEGMDLSQVQIDNSRGELSINRHRSNDFTPLIVSDVHIHPEWQVFENTTYIRSWMRTPLWYEGELLGVINFDHHEIGYFTDSHAEIAKIVAQHAAIALGHAHLYEQAQSEIKARETIQEVMLNNMLSLDTLYWALDTLFSADKIADCMDEIIEALISVMNTNQIIFIVFDATSGQIVSDLTLLETVENPWYVFKNALRLPYLPDNMMPPKPVVWEHGQIRTLPDGRTCIGGIVCKRGALIVVRHADEPAFTATEQELIGTISNQLTLAIDNERLYQELEEHSRQLNRSAKMYVQKFDAERKSFETIFNATDQGIFYIQNFRFGYVNPAFMRMVGYTHEELYGKAFDFVQAPSVGTPILDIQQLIAESTSVEGHREVRLRHQDGTDFYASIHYTLLQHQEAVQMVAIVRDISEERELYFQQSRFITNAAHELRTPLSNLILRLHLLRKQPERTEEHLKHLDTVTVYLRKLVEELFALSRFERGQISLDRQVCDMRDIIHEAHQTYEPFAQSEQVIIELNLPQKAVNVSVDRIRCIQMVGNLVANGINYNKKQGYVWITLKEAVDHHKQPVILIEVRDTGVGIPEYLLPKQIFEPFVRPSLGSRQETGMGLAMVRDIVQLHGGTIEVESKEGQGSTFKIILPLS